MVLIFVFFTNTVTLPRGKPLSFAVMAPVIILSWAVAWIADKRMVRAIQYCAIFFISVSEFRFLMRSILKLQNIFIENSSAGNLSIKLIFFRDLRSKTFSLYYEKRKAHLDKYVCQSNL